MTYLSQPVGSGYGGCGCSSGASSFTGSSGYSSLSSSMSSIDSFVSQYSGSAVSTMESAVQVYQPTFLGTETEQAAGNNYGISESIASAVYGNIGSGYQKRSPQQKPINSMADSFNPNMFLNRNRPAAPFIGSSEDIQHYVKDAFENTTGNKLPEDIIVRVVSQHDLRELHEEFGGQWNPGIQGFAINKKGFGQSMIICKESDLDRLLVVIGHEIGHVFKFPLANKLNEEAKAFAFEIAWLKAMYKHNIAGMKNSINPNPEPARNGLHDVALRFVRNEIKAGKECMNIIDDLMQNKIKVRGEQDGIL